jgi:uncharacterized protein (DUF433 family)
MKLVYPPRIVATPGRCSGKPRVKGTRVTTAAIGALFVDGFSVLRIVGLYPFLTRHDVEEALRFELPRIARRQAARLRRQWARAQE